MITYNGNILTTSTGKWYIPNRPYSISYSTVPNGSFSGPSQAYGGQLITVTATGSSSTYMLDYITVNGTRITGNTFIMPYGEVTVGGAFKINYNPLNLPAYTIRVVTANTSLDSTMNQRGATAVNRGKYQSTDYRVFDVTRNNSNWSSLFAGASTCKIIKVLGANTAGVTNMNNLFYYNMDLNEVALFDTSSVTDMTEMFKYCSNSLRTVPLFDTHNVTTMKGMFEAVSGGGQLRTCPNFDTSKVTNMEAMFRRQKQLQSFPNFDTSKVVNFGEMFASCSSITGAIHIYTLHQVSGGIDLGGMFYNCSSLSSVKPFYNYASRFTISDHVATFTGCTGASDYYSVPEDWR